MDDERGDRTRKGGNGRSRKRREESVVNMRAKDSVSRRLCGWIWIRLPGSLMPSK